MLTVLSKIEGRGRPYSVLHRSGDLFHHAHCVGISLKVKFDKLMRSGFLYLEFCDR
jgi:hypothetical protein